MKTSLQFDWHHYIETPQRTSAPIKIDKILEARMEAFLKARKVKPFKKHLV
jgi:hypothetical protein